MNERSEMNCISRLVRCFNGWRTRPNGSRLMLGYVVTKGVDFIGDEMTCYWSQDKWGRWSILMIAGPNTEDGHA